MITSSISIISKLLNIKFASGAEDLFPYLIVFNPSERHEVMAAANIDAVKSH